MHDSL